MVNPEITWFPYGRNGRKNRVTIFLNGQFIIVYTSELYIYIWSKNFSHSVNEKSEAKMAAIDVQ
jgi:hypothetical protein